MICEPAHLVAPGEPDRRSDPADAGFQLEASPFYWLTRVSGLYLMGMSTLLRGIGMDVPRWRVLMILAVHEPASISTLSEQAVVNLSTMTKIVQRMAADDLVTATTRAEDARITEVRLTEVGRAALAGVRSQASLVYRRAFGSMDGAEIEQLVTTLQTVFTRLEAPAPVRLKSRPPSPRSR